MNGLIQIRVYPNLVDKSLNVVPRLRPAACHLRAHTNTPIQRHDFNR